MDLQKNAQTVYMYNETYFYIQSIFKYQEQQQFQMCYHLFNGIVTNKIEYTREKENEEENKKGNMIFCNHIKRTSKILYFKH